MYKKKSMNFFNKNVIGRTDIVQWIWLGTVDVTHM